MESYPRTQACRAGSYRVYYWNLNHLTMNTQDKEECLACEVEETGGIIHLELHTCKKAQELKDMIVPTPPQDLQNTFREEEDKRFDEFCVVNKMVWINSAWHIDFLKAKQFLHDSHKRLVEKLKSDIVDSKYGICSAHKKWTENCATCDYMTINIADLFSIINQTLK